MRMQVLAMIVVAAVAPALGQDVAEATPQATIVIWEHATTADMVEITMLRQAYPAEDLRAIATRLGEETGSPPRGLAIYTAGYHGSDPRFQFLKASFATDHVIDRSAGVVRLQPIVRAFAGRAAASRIDALTVIFQGERPSGSTLKRYVSPAVRIEGSTLGNPIGLEYRVQLLTQDPARIEIPDRYVPPDRPVRSIAPDRTPGWLIGVLVGAAALVSGCLVYLIADRLGRRSAGRR
jgi:hypothetical protein